MQESRICAYQEISGKVWTLSPLSPMSRTTTPMSGGHAGGDYPFNAIEDTYCEGK